MKKVLLIILGVTLIGISIIGYKVYSNLAELEDSFKSEHLLNDPSIVLVGDSISPDGTYKYYEYQFDNGGFGYSRVFWSVIENKQNHNNLKNGIIPDGYKILGWTKDNELILKKWKPYYGIEKNIELRNGMEYNGAKIILTK